MPPKYDHDDPVDIRESCGRVASAVLEEELTDEDGESSDDSSEDWDSQPSATHSQQACSSGSTCRSHRASSKPAASSKPSNLAQIDWHRLALSPVRNFTPISQQTNSTLNYNNQFKKSALNPKRFQNARKPRKRKRRGTKKKTCKKS